MCKKIIHKTTKYCLLFGRTQLSRMQGHHPTSIQHPTNQAKHYQRMIPSLVENLKLIFMLLWISKCFNQRICNSKQIIDKKRPPNKTKENFMTLFFFPLNLLSFSNAQNCRIKIVLYHLAHFLF